ncbi:MAG: aspartyl protease family protein [Armatimonadetes bacterium]|nr:aspartyl protease family protein [Armatimonadota bacterium]
MKIICVVVALGASLFAQAMGTYVLRGTGMIQGAKQKIEIVYDEQFRFRETVRGPIPEVTAFDGKKMWVVGSSGVGHTVFAGAADFSVIPMMVMTGQWKMPQSPLQMTATTTNSFTLRLRESGQAVSLLLDPLTNNPIEMTHWGADGVDKWTLSNYKTQHGITFPGHVEVHGGGQAISLDFESAAVLPAEGDFKMPSPDGSATYIKGAKPEIEVMRRFGYLFVKPLVAGKDVGWFILDSGADVMVLDPAIARELGAKKIGVQPTAGVTATVDLDIFRGPTFQLGPVRLKSPAFFGLDLADIGKALEIKLGGIVGYDFFARCGVDIDPSAKVIGVYPPDAFVAPQNVNWVPMDFNSNVPVVSAKFEGDREGLFNLDTGSGSTVDFCSPAVVKFELLKDRKVGTSQTGGAGGSSVSKTGSVKFFEFGGRRFENPSVGFQVTEKGLLSSPYFTGNIGMGFMGKMRVIFDYANQRVSLK